MPEPGPARSLTTSKHFLLTFNYGNVCPDCRLTYHATTTTTTIAMKSPLGTVSDSGLSMSLRLADHVAFSLAR